MRLDSYLPEACFDWGTQLTETEDCQKSSNLLTCTVGTDGQGLAEVFWSASSTMMPVTPATCPVTGTEVITFTSSMLEDGGTSSCDDATAKTDPTFDCTLVAKIGDCGKVGDPSEGNCVQNQENSYD